MDDLVTKDDCDLYDQCIVLQKRINQLQKLIAPCRCALTLGMCVPCAMRERVAAGDSVESVVRDFPGDEK